MWYQRAAQESVSQLKTRAAQRRRKQPAECGEVVCSLRSPMYKGRVPFVSIVEQWRTVFAPASEQSKCFSFGLDHCRTT